jgi:hypothetical protein
MTSAVFQQPTKRGASALPTKVFFVSTTTRFRSKQIVSQAFSKYHKDPLPVYGVDSTSQQWKSMTRSPPVTVEAPPHPLRPLLHNNLGHVKTLRATTISPTLS